MSAVIAIDGPAAAGKGTLARSICRELGYAHLDTGLLYRAVARLALDRDIDLADDAAVTEIALLLTPDDLNRPDLRSEEVGQAASKVSAIPGVRGALFEFQRAFARQPPHGVGAVIDGRDIGTVICPDADVKFFVLADPAVRAERRYREALAKGEAADLDQITASLLERDKREATRATAPMRPAADAIILDTSYLTVGEVLEVALEVIEARSGVDACSDRERRIA